MNRKRPITELLLATGVVAVNAFICVFAGVWGGRCLNEVYGDAAEFALCTKLALSAHIWSPILLGAAFVLYLFARGRQQDSGLAFGILSLFASCVSALVICGMYLPFTRTTFRMGNHAGLTSPAKPATKPADKDPATDQPLH